MLFPLLLLLLQLQGNKFYKEAQENTGQANYESSYQEKADNTGWANYGNVLALIREFVTSPREVNNIKKYLAEHMDLIEPLYAAIQLIVFENFPGKISLSIKIYEDPEIDDRYLLINVRSDSYDENFIEKLMKTTLEFSTYLSGKSGWIEITSDFSTPG